MAEVNRILDQMEAEREANQETATLREQWTREWYAYCEREADYD